MMEFVKTALLKQSPSIYSSFFNTYTYLQITVDRLVPKCNSKPTVVSDSTSKTKLEISMVIDVLYTHF